MYVGALIPGLLLCVLGLRILVWYCVRCGSDYWFVIVCGVAVITGLLLCAVWQ